MATAPAERFTVGRLLEDLLRSRPDPADPHEVEELVRWFTDEATERLAGCPPEARPLRLPKERITSLLACERMTIARLGSHPLSEPLVRGRCTDLQVAQHVTTGLTEDVEADLRDALLARGDADVVAWIDAADPVAQERLWQHAGRVRTALRSGWGPVDPAWWPRPQERVQVALGGGDLLLACTFDLALGGPPTGRPWVLVEVKAGPARDGNRTDLLWYSLIAALRHRRAPDLVAAWSAGDDGLVPVPIGPGPLEAAARRALAALDRLVELRPGREPTVHPHGGCRWCPELDRCPPGLASLDAPRVAPVTGDLVEDVDEWMRDDNGW